MTPKQEEALRGYLQEAIVPLIEQVLVKKLGQAMTFAKEELPAPAQQVTDGQVEAALKAAHMHSTAESRKDMRRAIEAAHGIKENT